MATEQDFLGHVDPEDIDPTNAIDGFDWQMQQRDAKQAAENSYRPHGDRFRCRRCGSTIQSLLEAHHILVEGSYTGLKVQVGKPFCPGCDGPPTIDRRPINLALGTRIRLEVM